MAVRTAQWTIVAGTGHNLPYYICDTEGERPTSGLELGANCFCIDTGKVYRATSSTTWTETGGAGGSANPVVLWMHAGPASVWTNMPATAQEFYNNAHRRVIADCTGFTDVRVRWRQVVAGSASAVLRLRYAPDDSAFVTIGGDVSLVGTGWKDTGWMALPSGAKVNNCTFQLQGQNGDGAADPSFSSVAVWLR